MAPAFAKTVRSVAEVSDATLVQLARDGDTAAFDELYGRHVDAALTLAERLTGTRQDAEELVTEAFTTMWSTLRRGGGPDVAFRPYLMVCVRNAWRLADDDADPLAAVVASSLVAKAFFSLPARWQHVLWRTQVEGCRPSDLVGECGPSAASITALSSRASEGLVEAYLDASLPRRAGASECRRVLVLVPTYLRQRLDRAATDRVEGHLAMCPTCRAACDDVRDLGRSLRAALVPAVADMQAEVGVARRVVRGVWRAMRDATR